MKTKKIVSVVLCAAFISGIAGCTENKKPTNESRIYSVVNEYGEALTDLDGDAVLGLTDWKRTALIIWLLKICLISQVMT